MRRLSSGMVVPLLLAVAGVALIIVGQLDIDQPPGPSLAPIPDPSSPVAVGSATQTERATPGESATGAPTDAPTGAPTPDPTPEPSPIPDDWVATQIQIESVNLNVAVRQSTDPNIDDFPPSDAAYILRNSSQPGRGTNSYLFAHAVRHLFKPLWNVQLGAEVKILMSDGAVLQYVVTEVRPNISCPDDRAAPNPSPPLALRYAPPGCEEGAAWTQSTDHERLTLQTSQGFNRNYGELIIIAEPVAG